MIDEHLASFEKRMVCSFDWKFESEEWKGGWRWAEGEKEEEDKDKQTGKEKLRVPSSH